MPDYAGRSFHDKAERVAEAISHAFHVADAPAGDVDELPGYHDLIALAANILRAEYPNG